MRKSVGEREARCVVLRGSHRIVRSLEKALRDGSALSKRGEPGLLICRFVGDKTDRFEIETVATWLEESSEVGKEETGKDEAKENRAGEEPEAKVVTCVDKSIVARSTRGEEKKTRCRTAIPDCDRARNARSSDRFRRESGR